VAATPYQMQNEKEYLREANHIRTVADLFMNHNINMSNTTNMSNTNNMSITWKYYHHMLDRWI
jgi:hypothetical protein